MIIMTPNVFEILPVIFAPDEYRTWHNKYESATKYKPYSYCIIIEQTCLYLDPNWARNNLEKKVSGLWGLTNQIRSNNDSVVFVLY